MCAHIFVCVCACVCVCVCVCERESKRAHAYGSFSEADCLGVGLHVKQVHTMSGWHFSFNCHSAKVQITSSKCWLSRKRQSL